MTNSVARLGGDEFTILLTDLAEPGAIEAVALRLLETMRRPFSFSGHELFVTASIGVATYPIDGGDVDTLLRKADIAMYAVKDSGRNGVMRFSSAMNTATAERWRLETALHRALEREELVMYYQPKVNVIDGSIVGAEALMRWKRGGELVPPGEFITVAEESGLIVPITEWAVREVCKQMVAWAEDGMPPMPVSINISGRHIQRANLVEPVQAALAGFRLDARLLELELTETVLMQNLGHALPLLQALKELGVAISVDDFGTGYSSLSYLKKLPIDTLKIDRSFVRELETSGDNAAIVAAIIAMSKSLKLRVVAEGVETQGQMTRLFRPGLPVDAGIPVLAGRAGGRFSRPDPQCGGAPALAREFRPAPCRDDATGGQRRALQRPSPWHDRVRVRGTAAAARRGAARNAAGRRKRRRTRWAARSRTQMGDAFHRTRRLIRGTGPARALAFRRANCGVDSWRFYSTRPCLMA